MDFNSVVKLLSFISKFFNKLIIQSETFFNNTGSCNYSIYKSKRSAERRGEGCLAYNCFWTGLAQNLWSIFSAS